MKRISFMVLLVGGMLVAAFGQASAAKPTARSGDNSSGNRLAAVVAGKHMLPLLFFRSMELVPETTVSVTSITQTCNGNGTVSGTITLSGKYTGTIRIALYYHVPHQGEFFPTGATATATFNNSSTATYTISYTQHAGANTYRVEVTGATAGVGSPSSVNVSGCPQNCEKSDSFTCTGVVTTSTSTSTVQATATNTPTNTAGPSATATNTATITPTNTAGPSPTATLTNTAGPSPTPTLTNTAGPSPTATLTNTAGPSPTPTNTSTPGPSPTPTNTVGLTPGVVVSTPTNTPVAATPTNTSVVVVPTNTPVPAVPTNTPKPHKKPKPTATAIPTVIASKLPRTGFGGTFKVGASTESLPFGSLTSRTNFSTSPSRSQSRFHGLGIKSEPKTGGGNGGNPSTPWMPLTIGVFLIGLGAATRRYAFARR